MSKIKILHCTIGSMNIGGIENMIMQMYRNIDRENFSFDFLVHDPNKNVYEDEINSLGGQLYRVDFFSRHPIKHIKQIIQFFKSHPEYQIVHIHTTYSIMFIDAMIAKWFKRTVIIHSHNSSTRGKRKVVHKCLKAFQDNFADYRVACSDFAANWMFSKNVLDQVTFWPNALNIDSLKFDEISREELRQKYGATKKFIIGNVGRLSFQKNQYKLIDIFSSYIREYPNVNAELWLIGDGPDKEKLIAYTRELKITNRVRFMGTQKDITKYLSAMDLFIMTSHYEGLPLSLIESQAAGLPTLTVSNGITKLVKVSPYLKYMENSATNIEWNKIIDELRNNQTDRSAAYSFLENSNFNISNWILKVQDYYKKIEKGVS